MSLGNMDPTGKLKLWLWDVSEMTCSAFPLFLGILALISFVETGDVGHSVVRRLMQADDCRRDILSAAHAYARRILCSSLPP